MFGPQITWLFPFHHEFSPLLCAYRNTIRAQVQVHTRVRRIIIREITISNYPLITRISAQGPSQGGLPQDSEACFCSSHQHVYVFLHPSFGHGICFISGVCLPAVVSGTECVNSFPSISGLDKSRKGQVS